MAVKNSTAEIDARAKQASKNLNKFDESTQFAVFKVVPNVLNGVFWGFCTEQEMKKHLKALNANPNVVLRRIQSGYIVEIEPSYCIQVLQAVDAESITQKDIEVMRKNIAEAQIAFEKFLINKGKKPDQATGKQYQGVVGVYCINDVTTICYKGANYPAFRLDANNFCQLLKKYGYMINYGNKWFDPMQLLQSGDLFTLMQISPTKTGAFIYIGSTVGYDQMKQAEKNFKAVYGKK